MFSFDITSLALQAQGEQGLPMGQVFKFQVLQGQLLVLL